MSALKWEFWLIYGDFSALKTFKKKYGVALKEALDKKISSTLDLNFDWPMGILLL